MVKPMESCTCLPTKQINMDVDTIVDFVIQSGQVSEGGG